MPFFVQALQHGHANNVSRRGEPLRLHLSRRHRVRLVGEGILVGLAVGTVIAFYRYCLAHAEQLLRSLTTFLQAMGPLFVLLWPLILALVCLVVGRLMLWEPYTQGSGIPQIDAEVAGRLDMPWRRVACIKFVEGILVAFAGLSLGREGPSVQLGGLTAKGVSRLCKNERSHERLLVTCGAAAGMSAAFHAPLTGVLFAVEEIHKEFSAVLVISVMTASVMADYVSSQILGVAPLVHFITFTAIPHQMMPMVLGLGLACGLFGWLHNKGMFFMQERAFGHMDHMLPYVRLSIPFAIAGLTAFLWPDLMCGGDAIIERIIHVRQQTLLGLGLLLVGKYLFTSLCFGSGAPGGTLFPLVVMGALVGAIYGMVITPVSGATLSYENNYIVLGMAGVFSAVIQAPVTAVVLVFELTGSLDAFLATTLVSIVAYVTSTLLGSDPFYEHLYARLLGDSLSDDSPRATGHKILRSYVIGPMSTADGACVRNIAWPSNTLVVTVTRAGKEIVAKGDTRLEALDELSVLMDEGLEVSIDSHIKNIVATQDG